MAGVSWSAGEVLRASEAWVSVWFPPDAVHVDLGWLEFYVADGAATVMRVAPGDMTAAELAGRVLGELRGRHVAEAFWKVGPGYSPEGAGQALQKGQYDKAADQLWQRMTALPIARARRDGRDHGERIDARRPGEAPLVRTEVPPEDGGQPEREPAPDLAVQALVARQGVMQLLAGHAV